MAAITTYHPVSIDPSVISEEESSHGSFVESSIPPPLDERVIEVVQSSKLNPDGFYVIRPARLATELGLSMEDACAELCGLLAAVGGGLDGAFFAFEKTDDNRTVMVFQFPSNFAKRAANYRRKETLRQTMYRVGYMMARATQVAIAFGLILSLFILCILAIAGLAALLIALSRSGSGGRNETQRVMHQIRLFSYTLRELLWCFALFGPDEAGGTSFFREIAYDCSLCLSVCCGNPTSIFYWMRVNQLSRRHQRAFRGWGNRTVASRQDAYGVEGVSLIAPREVDRPATTTTEISAEYEGILSIAVEFLFGRSSFQNRPSSEERWRLRAAFLVNHLSNHSGVSLLQLCRYVDYPPADREDLSQISEQGLEIVSHFNGVPVQDSDSNTLLQDAKFSFPELLAESECANGQRSSSFEEEEEDAQWLSILYKSDTPMRMTTEVPPYLKEPLYRLTHLPLNVFIKCMTLGSLNLVGVVMLGFSLQPGGILELDDSTTIAFALTKVLLPLLRGYAVLFFVLPLARLLLIIGLNVRRKRRNSKRKALVRE